MKKILCLLLLAVMLLLPSCAPRLGDKASLTDWFHENEDAFMEAAESGDFTSLEKLRGVESVSRSDGCVDILCGGNGFGPGTHYYGLYYAEEDIWAEFAADPSSPWTVEGDGYRFREKDGDNVFYVEPLGGGYYYYEQHF